MKKRVFLFSTLAAAALVLSACNDYVGKEKSHPLYVKAAKEKSAGEYKEAARCYEEFMLICPKSSFTHNELANLYNDYLNDPLQAVYHYRKWLEMNPNDKTSYEDIRILAETAQKNLFKKLQEEYKDSAEAKKSDEELQKLKDQLVQAQNSLKQYEEQNQKMKEKLLAVRGGADEYVFHTKTGSPIPHGTFKRMWCRLMFAAGCVEWRKVKPGTSRPDDILKQIKPTLTPHYFRHNYITMLYESGVDPLMAMKIVGHTDYQTTANIYTHIKEDMLKKATVDLNSVFKKRAGKDKEKAD